MCLRTRTSKLVLLTLSTLTGVGSAGEIQVIYTEVPGHPTAVVPGAVDLLGMPIVTEFKAMETLSVSPDGSQWLLKGRNHAGADLETMLLHGAGTTGAVLAQEGQPVHAGVAGEVYDFLGSSPAHFNELNQFVYTARARGGDPDTFQKGIFFDGATFSMEREMGDAALGLSDLAPNPSGDELFGNSFGSFHVLNDGTIGSQDSTIQNIHSSRRPAIFYDDTAFLQSGISAVDGGVWDSFDSNDFWTTPDGSRWIAQGDDEGATATDDILVVSGVVALRQGSTVGASAVVVDNIFHTKLVSSGSWFSRGDNAADDDWAASNGALVAATGGAITTGSAESWSNVFLGFTGNRLGDWVLAGNTDVGDTATDNVIVLNGTDVVVREGDPVDLDGNGVFDDGAFIGRGNLTSSAFLADDLFLTDEGLLYFLAPLHDGLGNDLGTFGTGGDAFLRVCVVPCPADLDGDCAVSVVDLLGLLAAWGPCPGCPEDLDEDGFVTVVDLLELLGGWGGCLN